MSIKFKKVLNGIKPYVPGKPINEVKRELRLKNVIKLASNENPFGASPKVIKAMTSAAREVNRYPDGGCFYLRNELSKRLKVSPQQLVFGNGSDEIIVLCIRALVNPGDEVIIAKPSFLIYDIASRIEGGKVKAIPLVDNKYDLPRMIKAVSKKTKIIFLGNPDNPSGTFIPAKDMEKLIKSVRKDILIFIDEAYFEYVNNRAYGNSINFVKKYKNVIVSRTFSKMYGLAGLRIGYGVANVTLSETLNRMREPFNVNSVAQAAAVACLKDGPYYRQIAKKIEAQRRYLYKGLQSLGLNYKESCTNFILVDVQKDSKRVSQKLLKKGVIVRDMSVWGMKTFIRVTIGKQNENKAFLKALEAVL